jgi:TRAP-type C4-dicarboxylate transport system permease small subunit
MSDGDAPEPDHPNPQPPSAVLHLLFHGLPHAVIGTALLAGVAINFVNVIARHFFGFALFWAEELMVFGVIWCTAIAAIAITFNGDHLRMDLFSARLGGPWREIVNGFAGVLFVCVCGFVAYQSYSVVASFARTGMVSVTMAVPLTIPHAALLVGLTFMVLAVFARIYIRRRV